MFLFFYKKTDFCVKISVAGFVYAWPIMGKIPVSMQFLLTQKGSLVKVDKKPEFYKTGKKCYYWPKCFLSKPFFVSGQL